MTYDQFLLAICLWREARGASQQARAAVAAVVRNRAADEKGRWPKTIPGVILQPWQFSSFNANSTDAKFPVEPSAPRVSADWQAWLECCDAATVALEADPTGGANAYYSEPIPEAPKWADPSKLTTTIGPFRFYKL